jgi:hypothetical protein
MLNPFTWIREAARSAFLAGVGDAVAQLDAGDVHTVGAEALRQRLAVPRPQPELLGRPDALPGGSDAALGQPDAGKGRRRAGSKEASAA